MFAAAPVITNPSQVDLTYDIQNPDHLQFGYRIVATNSPVSFSAVGLPTNASINPSTGWINGTRDVPGIYDATISATNADGTTTSVVRFAIHPAAVGFGATPGQYQIGQTFSFTVAFNTEVTVAAGARLSFLVGQSSTATNRDAVYFSGSGTREITFRYTVQAGDTDSDGIFILGNALDADAIRDASGLTVGDSLPLRFFDAGITIVADAPVTPAPSTPPSSPPPSETPAPTPPPASTPAPENPAPTSPVASGGNGSGGTDTTPPSTGTSSPTTPPEEPVTPAVPAAPAAVARLANVSSRMRVVDGDASRTLIVGFVVSGDANKRVLVRAVGPGLNQFSVPNILANPGLRLQTNAGLTIAENDNWSGVDMNAVATGAGAFTLDQNSTDASLVTTLAPGAYTLTVATNGGTGEALAEIYDVDGPSNTATSQVVNLSTRGRVEGDVNPLIAGFVIKGNAPRRVLIRAVGPGLAPFLVPDVVADPSLTIHQGAEVIATNDNWQATAEMKTALQASGAFSVTEGSTDSAVLVTLNPGAYTAVVKGGTNRTSGAALVEVYELADANP